MKGHHAFNLFSCSYIISGYGNIMIHVFWRAIFALTINLKVFTFSFVSQSYKDANGSEVDSHFLTKPDISDQVSRSSQRCSISDPTASESEWCLVLSWSLQLSQQSLLSRCRSHLLST